jgi:hypothetical protein
MGDWDPADMLRQWSTEAAKGKEMTYAEAYRVVTLMDDKSWESRSDRWGEGARQSPPA